MKGIILAGGKGSRLYPNTSVLSKQLLPVYDKPMIYYPISTLMLAGIRDIAIISTPRDLPLFEQLLQDGSSLGININYIVQSEPKGLAHGILISKEFIGTDPICYILGDNIFYGQGFSETLHDSTKLKTGSIVYVYEVLDPQRFGIIELDKEGHPVSIEEKPQYPKSNLAVTGLYFYDNSVVDITKSLKPSARGELEITDLNTIYLEKKQLSVEALGRGFAWLDTGTNSSLLEAASFVSTLEKRQGFKVSCLEEIAWRQGWINDNQLEDLFSNFSDSDYGAYLKRLLEEKYIEARMP
jgi:glucose-1-phosphate thymidylyltransferase|tara:strand:+ start:934 stop:1824 length:891 start_codon:yes stop_codon:yes gene_type:complete